MKFAAILSSMFLCSFVNASDEASETERVDGYNAIQDPLRSSNPEAFVEPTSPVLSHEQMSCETSNLISFDFLYWATIPQFSMTVNHSETNNNKYYTKVPQQWAPGGRLNFTHISSNEWEFLFSGMALFGKQNLRVTGDNIFSFFGQEFFSLNTVLSAAAEMQLREYILRGEIGKKIWCSHKVSFQPVVGLWAFYNTRKFNARRVGLAQPQGQPLSATLDTSFNAYAASGGPSLGFDTEYRWNRSWSLFGTFRFVSALVWSHQMTHEELDVVGQLGNSSSLTGKNFGPGYSLSALTGLDWKRRSSQSNYVAHCKAALELWLQFNSFTSFGFTAYLGPTITAQIDF